MLKRNFILSILVLIITVTYLTYSKPAEVETVSSNNDFVDLSVINNITTIPGNLSNESLIIVNLWASWCIPCIEEVDELKKISQDSKFYVIGLLVDDSIENGEEFINKYSIDYVNVLLEDDVEFILTKFKWTGIPTSLVLNLDYEIIRLLMGLLNMRILMYFATKCYLKHVYN